MAKRKKRKKRPGPEPETAPGPFNPAVRSLVAVDEKIPEPEDLPVRSPDVPEKPVSGQKDLFLEAMADVTPLKAGKAIVSRAPDPGLRAPHPVRNDEMETVAHLSDLVAGNAEMDITFSDEYMEGCIHGLDPRLMRALKKGTFPVQDYIDLHGLTRQEAPGRLTDFLITGRALGKRCVLVVHGRGLNSENNVCVLKENVPVWLSTGPLKRMVLAFCTARPYDGGTGAVYVLLRNPSKR